MMFPPCSGACPPRPELGPPQQWRGQPPAARPHLRQPQLRRRGGGHLQARVPGQLIQGVTVLHLQAGVPGDIQGVTPTSA